MLLPTSLQEVQIESNTQINLCTCSDPDQKSIFKSRCKFPLVCQKDHTLGSERGMVRDNTFPLFLCTFALCTLLREIYSCKNLFWPSEKLAVDYQKKQIFSETKEKNCSKQIVHTCYPPHQDIEAGGHQNLGWIQ